MQTSRSVESNEQHPKVQYECPTLLHPPRNRRRAAARRRRASFGRFRFIGQRDFAAGQSDASASARATLWMEKDGLVQPIKVSVGITDGTVTEVQAEGLKEGMPVAFADRSVEHLADAGAGGSPFTPQIGRSRGAVSGGG